MLSHISLPFLLIDDSLECVTTVSGLKSGIRIRVGCWLLALRREKSRSQQDIGPRQSGQVHDQ
jgi:hypothetical protein